MQEIQVRTKYKEVIKLLNVNILVSNLLTFVFFYSQAGTLRKKKKNAQKYLYYSKWDKLSIFMDLLFS